MKSLRKIISDQQGMSLVFVLMIVTMGVGGIAYVATDMIPKLQSEKKKAESIIAYRGFIGSLNDYLVHGIRERWCLNYENGVTDLLLSNECSSGKSMEKIVTYPGNLERVLWGPENIGTELTAAPSLEESNKILSINYLRYHATPQKANKLLKYEHVYPADGKLKFQITKSILKDMSSEHPLYVMAQKVKDCVKQIDIEVFQVKDYANLAGGDERKIGINIMTDIASTPLSCLTLREANSTSFYTFYPRRLHTFSLMKYGNLDGKLHNEFHGPVYVAGDFVLPPAGTSKDKASVFYNTLSLGVYNSGKGKGKSGVFRAGRIVTADNSNYTFSDRGHPYLSKQDNYENFRGFLGGVHLDSSEDKGFYNLFDYSAETAGDVSSLEACIEENNSILKPSKNADSVLAYADYSTTSDSARMKLSFTKRNRFKPSQHAGKADADYNVGKENKDSRFLFKVDSKGGNRALGTVSLKYQSSSNTIEEYYGTMGVDSEVQIGLNLDYFKFNTKKIEDFLENVDEADRNSYQKAIDFDHALSKLPEFKSFQEAASNLKFKCDGEDKASDDCAPLAYSVKCDKNNPSSSCNFEKEKNNYLQSKDNLKNRLENIKQLLAEKKEAVMTVTLKHVSPVEGKIVLNQRYIDFSFPNEWRGFFALLKSELNQSINFTFTPYHYGPFNNIDLKVKIGGDEGNYLQLLEYEGKDKFKVKPLYTGGWYDTANNNKLEKDPKPLVELNCPEGMGVADWDLDMSGSTNFAWNYANTPPGAQVDSSDHEPAAPIIFEAGDDKNPPLEGHAASTTKSVVEECTIPPNRTHVYGFYVCKKLIIKDRTTPLYMIGTFIVHELIQSPGSNAPVYWHSIWDTKATDLIMTDLFATKKACDPSKKLLTKTWGDIVKDSHLSASVKACSPLDLVTNGPNNFSWTTVDPDIGIAQAGDVMTSQKANRIQKWIIREESRVDVVR